MIRKKKKPTAVPAAKGKPTMVKVGYRDIKIEWIAPDFKTDELTDCYGQYKAREGVIQLQNSLCGQEESNTLLHEILHAGVWVCSLSQTGQPLEHSKDEELVVNSLTNNLVQVFIDNEWLLPYLTNKLKK